MDSRNALVIEDERDLGALVGLHLSELGLASQHCFDGASGLKRALHEQWALIVLDLSLPGLDGIDVCRRLRERDTVTPLLMLTARDSESELAQGLDAGADDYLTKPFGAVELTARAKALLRRARHAAADGFRKIVADNVEMDFVQRTAQRDGAPLPLTAREFDLLAHFALHPGRVFTRAQLLDQVWGSTHDAYEHAVSSHINRLRAKIERDPRHPRYLITVWGIGYRLEHSTQRQ